MATSIQVTFDCADPQALGKFWASALGYIEQPPPEGFDSWESFLTSVEIPKEEWDKVYAIVDPDGAGPRIFFQKVPESKTVKNRVHLDVNVGGGPEVDVEERKKLVHAAVERLTGEGARQVQIFDQDGEYWIVMQDPEGNEFCLQ
jgi:Glyoxalase-like domain